VYSSYELSEGDVVEWEYVSLLVNLFIIYCQPFVLLAEVSVCFPYYRKSLSHLFIDVVKDNNQKDYKIIFVLLPFHILLFTQLTH